MIEKLVDSPDFEWLMIDGSHAKVHPDTSGAKGGNPKMSRSKAGSIPRYIRPQMRMIWRSEYLLQMVPLQIAVKLQN